MEAGCLAAKQGIARMPIRMPPARCNNAGGVLPTCTARASWPDAVFAQHVTRHVRHADFT